MDEKQAKLTLDEVAAIASTYFSRPVRKITAPGGKTRESVRVHFEHTTVIATQRASPGRMRLEIEVLARLSKQGAPVPRPLGQIERVFFQEDIGHNRLSTRLAHAEARDMQDAVAAAFASILAVQKAGAQAGLARVVPALGEAASWVTGLVSTPVLTAEKYGIAPPKLDYPALAARLTVPATKFIKWDARPGNAALGKDGRVFWFDWEHCGRRQGMEDFAWLAGDEFFPLDAEAVILILTDLLAPATRADNLEYLTHFIIFHIVQRLMIIHREFSRDGWDDPQDALRYDNIGVDPDLACALCQHGASWAERAALTRPLVRWFFEVEKAIKGMRGAVPGL